MLAGVSMAFSYDLPTGTNPADPRTRERLPRVQAAPARVLFLLGARDARAMSKPKTPADDTIGSSDSQEQQDSQRLSTSGAESPTNPYPWNLDFKQFVLYAAYHEPESDDFSEGWHSPLWRFTRLIRSWGREEWKAGAAFKDVNRVIVDAGGWETLLGVDEETANFEFTVAWKKVRFRKDEDPLHQAFVKATKHPVNYKKQDGDGRPTPGYDRFISLVTWLQFTRGEASIYLPLQKVAKILSTDQRMISLWRQQAIADGFIEMIARHHYKPGSKGRATEFKVKDGFMEQAKVFLEKNLK